MVILFVLSCLPLSVKMLREFYLRIGDLVRMEQTFSVEFIKILVKISAQPHTILCIQFLDRENNDKNNTLPLGKQICFIIVWGCAEILPNDS